MNIYEEGVDYSFVPYDNEYASIKILDGEYENTIYMYGNVNFDETDGQAYLSFNYEILDSDLDKTILEDDEDFKQYIGDILSSILIKKLEQEKKIHEFGTVDIEESNSK
jgi:hypothetical protein